MRVHVHVCCNVITSRQLRLPSFVTQTAINGNHETHAPTNQFVFLYRASHIFLAALPDMLGLLK